MADYSELKRKAQEIRDEVKAGANTANRVGLALEETVNALEAENQRAEQAEQDLQNAVQLLQDETEDLQSIRDEVERLGSEKADKSALEATDKEVSKKQDKLELYKEDPSNGSVAIFAQDVVSIQNDSQGGVSCVKVYNEEDTAEGLIPVARMSAEKDNGDSASVTVRGNEVHIDGDAVKVNGVDLDDVGVTIVNDLTTGGADKALSAEMGKVLAKEATTEHKGLMSAEDKNALDDLLRTPKEATLNYTTTYQNLPLPFTIQKGSTIRLSRDVKVTCRTNSTDTTYQLVTDGVVADRDINFVKSSEFTGDLTITAISKGAIDNLSDEINNLKDIVNPLLGITQEATVNYTAEYQNRQLPFTVKQGSTIRLSRDVKVTCRTNSTDTTYQLVTDGVVADRDINFVKSSEFTGDLTITAISKGAIDNLSDEINELKEDISEYGNKLMTAKEGTGIAYREMSRCGLRPIKILGVGNSWTGNATLYLGNILNSLGLSADISTSYAGAATLEMYNNNISNPTPIFTHRRWNKNTGSWDESDVLPYEDIFMSEDWDIVTHQQQSARAGKYDTFQPYLNNIINWEKKVSRVSPLIAMHATWAYPNGYDNAMFEEYYGSDTTTMYNAVLSAYNQAMIDEKISLIFPSAPMIQQVRTLGIESIDTPDGGSHLSSNGCFAASCVWAEMLLRYYYYDSVSNGKSITDSSYKPSSLSEEQASQIRALAVEIVNNVSSYFPNVK